MLLLPVVVAVVAVAIEAAVQVNLLLGHAARRRQVPMLGKMDNPKVATVVVPAVVVVAGEVAKAAKLEMEIKAALLGRTV